MAVSWIFSRNQARDLNGRAYPGALAYFYDAGTTTPRVVYQDNDLSVPHAHPIVADANGRFPRVYLPTGLFREKVTTAGGVLLWDDDGIDATPQSVTIEGGGGDTFETGDTMWRATASTRAGWVRMNGRTIGKTSSSATERANDDTEDLFLWLWDASSILTVSSDRGGSAASDWAANKTIALPDLRVAPPIGLAGMGNSVLSLDSSIPFDSGSSVTAASRLGSQTNTLVPENLPSDALTSDGASVRHQHRIPATAIAAQIQTGSTPLNLLVSEALASGLLTGDDTPDHTHSDTLGTDTPINNMPPGVLGTWYIKL